MKIESGISAQLGRAPVADKNIETPAQKIPEFKLPHKGSVDKVA